MDTRVTVSVADGTAIAGEDFTAVPAFTVTIPAGEISDTATFDWVVTGDTVAEEDETLTVSGTAPDFTTINPADTDNHRRRHRSDGDHAVDHSDPCAGR